MLIVYVGEYSAVFAEGLEFTKGVPTLVSTTSAANLLRSPLFEKYEPEAPAAPAAVEAEPETETVDETDKPLAFLNRKNS